MKRIISNQNEFCFETKTTMDDLFHDNRGWLNLLSGFQVIISRQKETKAVHRRWKITIVWFDWLIDLIDLRLYQMYQIQRTLFILSLIWNVTKLAGSANLLSTSKEYREYLGRVRIISNTWNWLLKISVQKVVKD